APSEHLRPDWRARVEARVAGPALDVRPRLGAPRRLPNRRCNRPRWLRGGAPAGAGMIEFGAAGLAAAFAAGFVSFLSPCVLPLVPRYLSLVSGAGFDDVAEQP